MSTLQTVLSSLIIAAAGTGMFATVTHGFQAYTSAGLLRVSIQQAPRSVPAVPMQAANGHLINMAQLRGRWLVAGFMYTRCPTLCSVQGSGFAQLRAALRDAIAQHQVSLVSISFDPRHDTPAALSNYQQRYGAVTDGWLAMRPTNRDGLQTLLEVFGVKAIPDGLGGFEHNAAFNLINPEGQLVAILNWDDPLAAARHVLAQLHQDP